MHVGLDKTGTEEFCDARMQQEARQTKELKRNKPTKEADITVSIPQTLSTDIGSLQRKEGCLKTR